MLRKFFHCILLAKSPNNKHSVFEPARCYRVWPSPNPPQNDLFFSIGFSRKCRFLQNWGSSKKSMSPGECSAHLSEDLYFWNISHVRLLPRLIWAEIGFLGFFRNIFPLNEVRSSCQEVFFCFCWKGPVFSLSHFAFLSQALEEVCPGWDRRNHWAMEESPRKAMEFAATVPGKKEMSRNIMLAGICSRM